MFDISHNDPNGEDESKVDDNDQVVRPGDAVKGGHILCPAVHHSDVGVDGVKGRGQGGEGVATVRGRHIKVTADSVIRNCCSCVKIPVVVVLSTD